MRGGGSYHNRPAFRAELGLGFPNVNSRYDDPASPVAQRAPAGAVYHMNISYQMQEYAKQVYQINGGISWKNHENLPNILILYEIAACVKHNIHRLFTIAPVFCGLSRPGNMHKKSAPRSPVSRVAGTLLTPKAALSDGLTMHICLHTSSRR